MKEEEKNKEFLEFKETILRSTKFEVSMIATKFKEYLKANQDEFTSMQGYTMALVQLNLSNYVQAIHDTRGTGGKDNTEFIKAYDDILEVMSPHLAGVVKLFSDELEELKVSDPELYDEFKRIIDKEIDNEERREKGEWPY